MIAKHIHCQPEHDQYGRLARYIADAGHDGEKCLASWCAGCVTDDDYELAIVEAQAAQALNTRSAKEKTYHLIVSFRPEDEAKLTPEAFKAIEKRFAASLGFSEHQRHCGVHKNTNNIHLHMAYNMVHPEKLTRHAPYFDYQQLSKTSRQLEQEYGLAVDNGMEQVRKDRLSQKAATLEARTGQESFESYAKRNKAEIVKKLEQSRNWQAFHEALKAHGMGIKPHGNGLVVTNSHGEQAVKASAVDRALSAKRLQERLGVFQPYRSLRPVQELSHYQAVPLHRSPERGELFAAYKVGIETRKVRLVTVKEKEDASIAAIRQQWTEKRRELEHMNIAKHNRRNLIALARKHEAEAIAKAKLAVQPEREAVRREVPFTSWNAFLQMKAEGGNETALAVLRSRKEAVEPETPSLAPSAIPAKDWSQHGREQFFGQQAAMRAEYAEKERELQERTDISAPGKKQLQAFLRMERVIAEARAPGLEPGEMKRRMDGKGVVIFALENGGSIRDAGNDLHFSRGKETEALALLYARAKWGKNISLDGNRFSQSEIEVTREQRWGLER